MATLFWAPALGCSIFAVREFHGPIGEALIAPFWASFASLLVTNTLFGIIWYGILPRI